MIDDATFKQAMAQFATGVTIMTTRSGDGNLGITANSFSSVSLDPPLVLVCVAKPLFMHDQLLDSKVFAVSVLGSQQKIWGDRFAGRHPDVEDRFEGVDFFTAVTGSPILEGSLSWVDCQLRHAYPAGDHTIFVGEVVAGAAAGADEPLIYYNSRWAGLAAEAEAAGSNEQLEPVSTEG